MCADGFPLSTFPGAARWRGEDRSADEACVSRTVSCFPDITDAVLPPPHPTSSAFFFPCPKGARRGGRACGPGRSSVVTQRTVHLDLLSVCAVLSPLHNQAPTGLVSPAGLSCGLGEGPSCGRCLRGSRWPHLHSGHRRCQGFLSLLSEPAGRRLSPQRTHAMPTWRNGWSSAHFYPWTPGDS